MKRTIWALAMVTMVGCVSAEMKTPTMGFDLGDKYASPDGMTIGPDGSIYLSMNGAGADFAFAHKARIMRITVDNELEEFFELPPHPDSKVASPLGLVFGPDGNLYVSDNQAFAGGENASRLLQIVIREGKPVSCGAVVTGLQMANGIAAWGDSLYLNETSIDADVNPMTSGVYRFKVTDLDPRKPIKVTGVEDPRFFLKIETAYADDLHKVGANGIDFDSKGNLYVADFGEAEIMKVTLKDDGSVDAVTTLCKGQGMESVDGFHIDEDDTLWAADFLGNAIARVNTTSGKVRIIAKNAPGDGKNGLLDAPSEVIRRGDTLYVSNIDITYGPNTADDLQTISLIRLK